MNAMTEVEARTATESIRSALDRVSTAWAALAGLITDAYQRRADLALGYGSWAEYAEAELKPAEGLAVEVRRQLVGMLSQAGMSARAIAPTVGASIGTVHADRSSGVQSLNTSPIAPTADNERLDRETGELTPPPNFPATDVTGWAPEDVADMLADDDDRVDHWEATTVPAITGLDGKSYPKPEPRPEPAKPKRKPWPDALNAAVWALTKVTTTLTNLAGDDRATKYKGEAPRDTRNLAHAIDALQRVHDQIA